MKRSIILLLAIPLVCSALTPDDLASMSNKDIIDHIDRMLRGDASHGTMTMSVVTRRWKRSVTLEIWSKGTDKALIRVQAPRKEKGTATLKVGDDIWNYLPKIDRTIRIPSSMMMASWMGSHFTNDDLVKESRLIRDYAITRSFDGKRNEREELEFTLIPNDDAAVVWGKVVFVVGKADLIPLEARYYDESGELKRTLVYDQVRQFGERKLPARMIMTPADKPKESTTVLYDDLRFDVEVPDSTFSLQRLRRRK
jgi:outer membrane lipoprotein-sorting protein